MIQSLEEFRGPGTQRLSMPRVSLGPGTVNGYLCGSRQLKAADCFSTHPMANPSEQLVLRPSHNSNL